MLAILICLIIIKLTIDKAELSLKDKIFVSIPFSVYFGWITVATVANVTTFLVSISWNGFGIPESIWTAIIIIVGLIIGVATVIRFKDTPYGLVFIWAYTGILVKHISSAGFNGEYPMVIFAAALSIIIFIVITAKNLFKRVKVKYAL